MPDFHIRRDGDDYAEAAMALLPTGEAWPRESGTLLGKTVAGLVDVWGTIDGRAADLLEVEADPGSADELLPEWEHLFGLSGDGLTTTERRQAVAQRARLIGGQSREFFISVAAALGFEITITEHAPYICGISRCGDTGGRWELGPAEIRFMWHVAVPAASAPTLEPIFEAWRPAHTVIFFTYI
jgi:uncharacterized protein YmfQ (DUF2313 family)